MLDPVGRPIETDDATHQSTAEQVSRHDREHAVRFTSVRDVLANQFPPLDLPSPTRLRGEYLKRIQRRK